MRTASVITTASFLAALGACSEPNVSRSGAQLFAQNCATCHGSDGRGSGPASGDLKAAAPDLTRLSHVNGDQFPLVQTLSKIDGFRQEGARGHPEMPEFGARMSSPSIPFDSGDGIFTPTPKPLVDLALYLKSIQR